MAGAQFGPVLVVDDDEEARECVAEVLRDEGFEVETAADGCEALEFVARSPPPRALVLDLSMPRMDGREVLKRLKAHESSADIPVCIVSAETTLPGSADLALQKPLLVHRLTHLLRWLHECARTSAVKTGV